VRHAFLIWLDLEQNRVAIVERRSAMHWVDCIEILVLIMHGSVDEDILLEQSQRLDAELTRRGKTHDFVVFEAQQHLIGGRGKERDAAAVAWFRRFGASRKRGC
jgi:dipeptidyl aminopeptidase/acylaminoacyl peptidase